MIRIWTYLGSLVPPFPAGTYFDLAVGTYTASLTNNTVRVRTRSGVTVRVSDPVPLFDDMGQLMFPSSLVDIKDSTDANYLANTLYYHATNKQNLVIMTQSSQLTSRKASLVQLINFDENLVGLCNGDATEPVFLSGMGPLPDALKLSTDIIMTGVYTDYDDLDSITWDTRSFS
jgi:hypothetical protein